MFPKLALGDADTSSAASPEAKKRPPTIPLVPPRNAPTAEKYFTTDEDRETPMWFLVMSPREVKGTSGPFSIIDIRHLYRSGEVTDKTLSWREGEKAWKEIKNQPHLKNGLITIPPLPPKKGNFNVVLNVFDPIVELPAADRVEASKSIHPDFSKHCFRCGNIAAVHVPGYGEQIPDLFKTQEEVGSTEFASEVLPGFMWVGNSAASKPRAIYNVGITLLINCTATLRSPNSQPPYFRCKQIKMHEAPEDDFSPEELKIVIRDWDRVYDWIEFERVQPELAMKSDPIPKPYRGPTDEFGDPIKYADDKPFRKLKKGEKHFPPRVLLWSRLGTDRAVVTAAAYFIRQFGLKSERALDILNQARSNQKISVPYKKALEVWSKKYTLGALICADCKLAGTNKSFNSEDDTELENHIDQLEAMTGTGTEGVDDSTAITDATPVNTKYNSFVASILNNKPDTKLKEIADIIKPEGSQNLQSERYFKKVLTGPNDFSPWSGLIDLELPNVEMKDYTMAYLFRNLNKSCLLDQLRVIDLQSNQIENFGVKGMLLSYYPLEDGFENFDDALDFDYHFDADAKLFEIKPRDTNLTYLNLAFNRIDEEGAKHLNYFLKQTNSLVSLDISSNPVTTYGASHIFEALSRPNVSWSDYSGRPDLGISPAISDAAPDNITVPVEVDDEDEYQFMNLVRHNYSITNLRMDYCKESMVDDAIEALGQMLRYNVNLKALSLCMVTNVSPMKWKYLGNIIRVYNSTIERIDVTNCSFTVKGLGSFARIVDSVSSRIRHIDLSNSGLIDLHILRATPFFAHAVFLEHLNVSGNPISDSGIAAIADMIMGLPKPEGPAKITAADSVSMDEMNNSLSKHIPMGSVLDDGPAVAARGTSMAALPLDVPPERIGAYEDVLNDDEDSKRESQSMQTQEEHASFVASLKSQNGPPLRYLDVSNCGMSLKGCCQLFKAIGTRPTNQFQYLDISYNKIDPSTTAYCNKNQNNKGQWNKKPGTGHHAPDSTEESKQATSVSKDTELASNTIEIKSTDSLLGGPRQFSGQTFIENFFVVPPNSNDHQASRSQHNTNHGSTNSNNFYAMSSTPQSPDVKSSLVPPSQLNLNFGNQPANKFQPKKIFDINTPTNHGSRFQDLEQNAIGQSGCAELVEAMSHCSLIELNMSSCDLKSSGAAAIFRLLSNKLSPLSGTLKCIVLTGNDISDSTTPSLVQMLQNNTVMELMDLGFNAYTNYSAEQFRVAMATPSEAKLEYKLCDLTIRMVGNKCDPYILESPGMARSKSTFRYGLKPNRSDKLNGGYSHVIQKARKHLHERIQMLDLYDEVNPKLVQNAINRLN